MRRVFEEDKVYETVFSKDRLPADARRILLCYKVERKLRKLTEDIKQKGSAKYFFAPRARYLIWALVCQGILNDKQNLEALCDSDGRSLLVTASYSAYLSKIATTRVAVLLAELMADKEYADKIKEDKLGFLRRFREMYEARLQMEMGSKAADLTNCTDGGRLRSEARSRNPASVFMASTDFGIENLIDLIKMHKDDPTGNVRPYLKCVRRS